jgi:hypothetical protein
MGPGRSLESLRKTLVLFGQQAADSDGALRAGIAWSDNGPPHVPRWPQLIRPAVRPERFADPTDTRPGGTSS